MGFAFWVIIIPIILIGIGYLLIEEGQGLPSFINNLTLNASTLWNIGIITIAATLIVKYIMNN